MTHRQTEIGGIRLGPPQVDPTVPTHVRGVPGGNEPGRYARSPGHLADGRSTARRSTGINPQHAGPILPGMPSLSPA